MDKIHARLLKAFDYLKNKGIIHTQTQLAEKIGKTQQSVNAAFKDTPKRCTLGLMKAIADAFPNILNRDYLLTGEGDVAAPDPNRRPHYRAQAAAGFMDGLADGEAGDLRPLIPDVPDYDFTIEARGDSMLPEIQSGDILLCRRAIDRANPPLDRICVIDSTDGAAVKLITGADEDSLFLHSLNPDYPDYSLDLSSLLGVAPVVALLRRL